MFLENAPIVISRTTYSSPTSSPFQETNISWSTIEIHVALKMVRFFLDYFCKRIQFIHVGNFWFFSNAQNVKYYCEVDFQNVTQCMSSIKFNCWSQVFKYTNNATEHQAKVLKRLKKERSKALRKVDTFAYRCRRIENKYFCFCAIF